MEYVELVGLLIIFGVIADLHGRIRHTKRTVIAKPQGRRTREGGCPATFTPVMPHAMAISGHKSRQYGLASSINRNFNARRHFLICFSRLSVKPCWRKPYSSPASSIRISVAMSAPWFLGGLGGTWWTRGFDGRDFGGTVVQPKNPSVTGSSIGARPRAGMRSNFGLTCLCRWTPSVNRIFARSASKL